MPPEQSVIIRFENSKPDWTAFFQWEAAFRQAIANSGDGEYDGNELAMNFSDGFLFLYGPDADRLLSASVPLLRHAPFRSVTANLRYGSVDDEEAAVAHLQLDL